MKASVDKGPVRLLSAPHVSYAGHITPPTTSDERLLALIIRTAVVGVVLAILILRAIVRPRPRLRFGGTSDAVTVPPSPRLAVALRIVGLGASLLAYVELLVYLAACISSPKPIANGRATELYFLAASLLWFGSYCKQQSLRLRNPLAEEALASDARPAILFLRGSSEEGGFAVSGSGQWWLESSMPAALEDVVLGEFRKLGPVIGLSNPSLPNRPSAYHPHDTPSAEWQTRVETLMGGAAVIVIVLGQTKGLRWEIRRIRDLGYLRRALFILPPGPDAQQRVGWLSVELLLPIEAHWEAVNLAGNTDTQPLAIRFPGARPRAYMERPDQGGYMLAVGRALQEMNPTAVDGSLTGAALREALRGEVHGAAGSGGQARSSLRGIVTAGVCLALAIALPLAVRQKNQTAANKTGIDPSLEIFHIQLSAGTEPQRIEELLDRFRKIEGVGGAAAVLGLGNPIRLVRITAPDISADIEAGVGEHRFPLRPGPAAHPWRAPAAIQSNASDDRGQCSRRSLVAVARPNRQNPPPPLPESILACEGLRFRSRWNRHGPRFW